MEQYLKLLKDIKENGVRKPAARENMPGTTSLFGYQFRHNLSNGFPLLTTKKMFWKGIVCELLWFLRGDTNIKFLVDNGCNFWNEDAYNYFVKKCKEANQPYWSFDTFLYNLKNLEKPEDSPYSYYIQDYRLGDCGYQYGRVWRNWTKYDKGEYVQEEQGRVFYPAKIDQIKSVINSLKNNPEGRRHIVTAIDPAHDTDLALYWCHALFQFNCRPLSYKERADLFDKIPRDQKSSYGQWDNQDDDTRRFDDHNIPKYYLDCQLYQRSADVFLGVPFNIASYALLTHIIARMCNMIPGEFIHTFGDVHIYDNHMEAVNEQLTREPRELPKLKFSELVRWDCIDEEGKPFDPMDLFEPGVLGKWEFDLEDYNPHPAIKAELSTGLIKK